MLVLIATNELQGTVANDFAHTVEGELVTALGAECTAGDECGCGRGFPGLASGQATTTAKIVDRPGVTAADLHDAVHDWLDRCGWIELLEQTAAERALDGHEVAGDVDEIIEALIADHLDNIADVCSTFPEGTVVVRRGALVSTRSHPFAA